MIKTVREDIENNIDFLNKNLSTTIATGIEIVMIPQKTKNSSIGKP
jgi:histidinol phosphatase-like PHP family hydrolase